MEKRFHKGFRKIYPCKCFGEKEQKSSVSHYVLLVDPSIFSFAAYEVCTKDEKLLLMPLILTSLSWNISENIGVVGSQIKCMKFFSSLPFRQLALVQCFTRTFNISS